MAGRWSDRSTGKAGGRGSSRIMRRRAASTSSRGAAAPADTSVGYEEAVEEALCVGWIDSVAGRLDEQRGLQWFSPRRPTSGWARTNKARVERLIADGLMLPAGLAAIEEAKRNGSWTLLDDVENLVVPDDLAAALVADPAGSRALGRVQPVAAPGPPRMDHPGQATRDAGEPDRRGGRERGPQ